MRNDRKARRDARTLFAAALTAHGRGGAADAAALLRGRLASVPRGRFVAVAEDFLHETLTGLWDAGWQPVDVGRVVQKRSGAAESAVLAEVLAAQARTYAALGSRVAPGWMAQLDELDAAPSAGRPGFGDLDRPWGDVVAATVRLGALLGRLPGLPLLSPPPSRWHEAMSAADTSRLPAGLLEKVRNLLAKAESTDFDAEAEAFTAKAQELMARHRIASAVLAAEGRGHDDAPVHRRIGVDDPYAEAKALLLDRVASANGGRTVWSKELGFATVVAFADDLDATEALFTSLLVQATAALRREGSRHDGIGRNRTTRFRRSFLVAFAVRIGDRLRAAAEESVTGARAEHGDAFLPVLVARDEAVRDATERSFPDLRRFSPSATDGEGWAKGTRFADVADVAARGRVERRTAS